MQKTIFISYSHADIDEINWIKRLKRYLVPLQRSGVVKLWDDSKIETGSEWRKEIIDALDSAAAAILLVGPGFLASEFIMDHELPILLESAKRRGTRIFPLIVGYCGYENSELSRFQAANDPSSPLESLSISDQNKLLNEIAISVDRALRTLSENVKVQMKRKPTAKLDGIREIANLLNDTRIAFTAQCRRRNALVESLEKRLDFHSQLEYEKFFFRYFSEMNEEERFEFEQIRAMTEGPICHGNRRILEILQEFADLLDESITWRDLRQHLVFWLNKFDRVFVNNKAMCLLYTGVEDAVPFPPNMDEFVREWLERNSTSAKRDRGGCFGASLAADARASGPEALGTASLETALVTGTEPGQKNG